MTFLNTYLNTLKAPGATVVLLQDFIHT